MLGMKIVKQLDIVVCFGSDRFHVGQGEWEMMTISEKNRLVSPLVPTECAYAKLDDYFGKLQNAKITAIQMDGVLGNVRRRGESRKAEIKD